MKKISYVIAAIMLMFSLNAFANPATRNMLEQVSNINSSWRPVVGKSLYYLHKGHKDIAIICFYDSNTSNADPEHDDVQAVFVKSKDGYKLVATAFSSIDKVLENIDLLVP